MRLRTLHAGILATFMALASAAAAQQTETPELSPFQVRHGDVARDLQAAPLVPIPQEMIEPTGGFDKVEFRRGSGGDRTVPRGRAWQQDANAQRGPVGSGLTLDQGFESIDLQATSGISGFFSTPPDTMGAVGPTQFFTTQNGAYRVHDKATGATIGALDVSARNFWGPAVDPNNNGGGDPRVRFDRINDRWVVIAFELGASGQGDANNRLLIATSDGPTISAGTVWTQYYIIPKDASGGSGFNGCFADYPMLGVDRNAIYLGANFFARAAPCGGTNTGVLVIPLGTLPGAGGNVSALSTAFTNLLGTVPIWTPMPVDNPDPTATTGYIIGHDANSDTNLKLGKISNAGGAPGTPTITWSNIAISDKNDGYGNGVPYAGVPAPNGSSTWGLDALGFRPLGGAMVRNGRLWTSMTSSVEGPGGALRLFPLTGDRHSVVFFEIDVATNSLVQDGNVFDQTTARGADPLHSWMGSVAVNGQGHAVIGATVADISSTAPSAAWAGRLATDALGEFSEPSIFLTGTDTGDLRQSFESSARPTRWGDYAQATVDPCDDMTFYAIAEYQDSNPVVTGGNWATGVARVLAPAPTLASVSPMLVSGASTVVTVDGTGFYSPPTTGMPACRTDIEVTTDVAGLNVTDVTYNGPTQIEVTFDATGASGSLANVTVTNPDGQEIQFQLTLGSEIFSDGFEIGNTSNWSNTVP